MGRGRGMTSPRWVAGEVWEGPEGGLAPPNPPPPDAALRGEGGHREELSVPCRVSTALGLMGAGGLDGAVACVPATAGLGTQEALNKCTCLSEVRPCTSLSRRTEGP